MEVNDLIQIKNDLDDTVSQLSHKLVRLIGRQKEMENSISQGSTHQNLLILGLENFEITGPRHDHDIFKNRITPGLQENPAERAVRESLVSVTIVMWFLQSFKLTRQRKQLVQ